MLFIYLLFVVDYVTRVGYESGTIKNCAWTTAAAGGAGADALTDIAGGAGASSRWARTCDHRQHHGERNARGA
jgi:hypothetical protein